MDNHYSILGIQSSASPDEIRRAYRILARRYHPDLNPGQANVARFRKIAEAYEVLSDASRRASFDANLESKQREDVARGFAAYERAQAHRGRERRTAHRAHPQKNRSDGSEEQRKEPPPKTRPRTIRKVSQHMKEMLRSTLGIGEKGSRVESSERSRDSRTGVSIERVSVIEVSVSIRDAILGTKKTIEIPEPEGERKISVRIPAGVRSGSVIRLRAKNAPSEDLVLIVRVSSHPYVSIQTRGLVVEIPITVQEAVSGGHISIPTLDEPASIKIPPGSQSGSEIRLKGKGIVQKDGTRGDLFARLLVKVPDSPEAVGLRDKVTELEKYYSSAVRQGLPKTLVE